MPDVQRYKWPRTFHLPFSLGATDDDKMLKSIEHFVGKEIVVTEKMDGENTTVYSDGYVHARSVDGRPHPSQDWLRRVAGEFSYHLPVGTRVCGENVYAFHSIWYKDLCTYFYVFAMCEGTRSYPWDDVVLYSQMLALRTVPVLYRGVWDEDLVKACMTGESKVGGEQEGYVVRLASEFDIRDSAVSMAKFVRKGHVQEGTAHWAHSAIVPNKLRGGCV